jgi:DNA-binding XRE family transcriptional regulator
MAPRSTYKVITDDVKAIRALRERRGLSVNKAAPLIGTNKSTLTALENGRINLSEEWRSILDT